MTRLPHSPLRRDLNVISDWIPTHSKVLDLGCGRGELLQHLKQHKHCQVLGVDIDDANIAHCIELGVPILQQNLESGLQLFAAKHFDVAVLSQTLQSVQKTAEMLQEMARVAHSGIISFPNFGYWKHAFSLLRGRMPVTKQIPYQWYDTPNVHLCTLQDFEDLARANGLRLCDQATFSNHNGILHPVKHLAQWRATLAVYRFQSPRNA